MDENVVLVAQAQHRTDSYWSLTKSAIYLVPYQHLFYESTLLEFGFMIADQITTPGTFQLDSVNMSLRSDKRCRIFFGISIFTK
ncbi:hypothetical protein EY04_23930 [Pseudomonas chlororaphis]|nr:hypothetical protein EY04_23930 [Pseudomonas chlororaphis]